MRKIIYCFLLGMTAFWLAGCSGSGSSAEGGSKSSTSDNGTAAEGEGNAGKSGTEEELSKSNGTAEERNWTEQAKIHFGDSVEIDGNGAVFSQQVLSVSEGGSYELSGTFEGTIYVETKEAVRLVLNGLSVTGLEGPAIFVEDAPEVWIEISEGTENYLEDAKDYTSGKGTIFSNDNLIFTGSGNLEIVGNYKHGISSDDGITISGGNYVISAVKDGVNANEDLVVNGGRIQVTECEEGLESKTELRINGGTVEVEGIDDGLNGGTLVQINGGMVYVNMTTGDGLDSNGTLEINGGLVVAFGGSSPEGGADCDNNDFLINGGTLLAAGGVNSAPTESKCTQQTVLLGAASAGDAIGIKDSAGNTVFAFCPTKGYSNLLLTGAFLEEGNEYTVYTGGTIQGTETGYGYYENAEYDGGNESVSFTADTMVINAGGTTGMQGPGGGMNPGEDGGRPGRTGFPEGMELPEGAEAPDGKGMQDENGRPAGMEFPEGTELPEGAEAPDGSGRREGMEFPGGNELPKGEGVPDGSGQSEGEGNSSGTEAPNGTV